MNLEPNIHVIATALADRSRARMVCALMTGRAHTVKELACAAEVTPPTASAHLKVLEREGLVVPLKAGRNKFVRIASPAVAHLIETLSVLTSADHVRRIRPRGATPAMLEARSCYDHIAGRLGVSLFDRLAAMGAITCDADQAAVTASGVAVFTGLGIDMAALRAQRRPLARCCLDWTERRYHLAGSLAAAVLERMLAAGWIDRARTGRALVVTAAGRQMLAERFGLTDAANDAGDRLVS